MWKNDTYFKIERLILLLLLFWLQQSLLKIRKEKKVLQTPFHSLHLFSCKERLTLEEDLRRNGYNTHTHKHFKSSRTPSMANPPTGKSNGTFVTNDIAFSVLSKLPLKSIKRFSSACKSWSQEFEKPSF